LQTNIAHILMKSKLILILFLLFSAINYSQNHTKIEFTENDKLIYLDSTFQKCTETDHLYFRIIKDYKLERSSYSIYDFCKSGTLMMQGFSKDKDYLIKNGLFVYYCENGNKQLIANFVNDALEGQKSEWYENGNKKSTTNYLKGQNVGADSQWYENGNKKLVGENIQNIKNGTIESKVYQFWDDNGIQKVFDGNGDYEEKKEFFYSFGKVKDGFKDGIWEGYDKKIGYTFRENYMNQKMVTGVSIDSNKVSRNYEIIEILPQPKKNIEFFFRDIKKNVELDLVMKRKGGKIFFAFIVDEEGQILEPKIVISNGILPESKAINVVSICKCFIPAEIRGIKERYDFLIPI
jgi:antitoxin component YwqK of YwqJK toxin-antitoxin module